MGIRTISLGFAAAALLGTAPAMAAAPVTPSVAQLTLTPMAGTNLGAQRRGMVKSNSASNVAPAAGVLLAVLAAGAVAGGVVAATDSGGGHSTSP